MASTEAMSTGANKARAPTTPRRPVSTVTVLAAAINRAPSHLGQPNCSTMVAAAPETMVAAVPSKKMIMSPSTAGARRGPTAHWMTGRWDAALSRRPSRSTRTPKLANSAIASTRPARPHRP